jgi:hypothetical protein
MTLKEKAINEPRKVFGESTWNVGSNYYFCPTLCKGCENFYEENSTYPYNCKALVSDAPSHRSSKEGYKQYDDCKYYKSIEEKRAADRQREQKKADLIRREDDERQYRKDKREAEEREREAEKKRREREREERKEREWEERIREKEEKRTHCFICGRTGILEQFYGEYAHEKCFADFKESENGKKWIQDKEIAEEKIHLFLKNEVKLSSILKKYNNLIKLSPDGMKKVLKDYAPADCKRIYSYGSINIEYNDYEDDILAWNENRLFEFSSGMYKLFAAKNLGINNAEYEDYFSSKVLSEDEIDQFAQFMEKIFQNAKLQEEAEEKARKEKE